MSDGKPFDPDKTPVRSPSGALRLGLVPCPACRVDARDSCDLCSGEDGKPIRYVPVDASIAWIQDNEDTTFFEVDPPKPPPR